MKRNNPHIIPLDLPPGHRDALLSDVAQEATRRTAAAKNASYATPEGIVRFVREKLGGKPTPYQEKILRALVTDRRVAVRSPHGAGKTKLASWVVLWSMYALGDSVRCVTTASVERQLTKQLWPEIRHGLNKSKLTPRPRVLDTALRFDDQPKEAYAAVSNDPYKTEGVHAASVVFILDEAKAIPAPFWDAIEGALSTGECYVLAISTPGNPSGRFYDIHSRKAGYQDWSAIHVTLQEAIDAGQIKQKWVDDRRAQWGEQSAIFQNRVLGNFADSGEDAVIPLSWVEAANERYEKCGGKGTGKTTWGVDPARYGDDQTTIAQLTGRVLERLIYHSQLSTMETVGKVVHLVGTKEVAIGVDVIGIGAGVYDRLKELGFSNSVPVNVSASAKDTAGRPMKDDGGILEFVNLRSALWWRLREYLDPENENAIALPVDDLLTGDLTAPTWNYTSAGKIQVESKDDIRARIGRSTDSADAVALALFVAIGTPSRVARFLPNFFFGDATFAEFQAAAAAHDQDNPKEKWISRTLNGREMPDWWWEQQDETKEKNRQARDEWNEYAREQRRKGVIGF
jgi:hypothetical protein